MAGVPGPTEKNAERDKAVMRNADERARADAVRVEAIAFEQRHVNAEEERASLDTRKKALSAEIATLSAKQETLKIRLEQAEAETVKLKERYDILKGERAQAAKMLTDHLIELKRIDEEV